MTYLNNNRLTTKLFFFLNPQIHILSFTLCLASPLTLSVVLYILRPYTSVGSVPRTWIVRLSCVLKKKNNLLNANTPPPRNRLTFKLLKPERLIAMISWSTRRKDQIIASLLLWHIPHFLKALAPFSVNTSLSSTILQKQIFPEPPLTAFRRPSNLRDLLVHAKVKPPTSPEDPPGAFASVLQNVSFVLSLILVPSSQAQLLEKASQFYLISPARPTGSFI